MRTFSAYFCAYFVVIVDFVIIFAAFCTDFARLLPLAAYSHRRIADLPIVMPFDGSNSTGSVTRARLTRRSTKRARCDGSISRTQRLLLSVATAATAADLLLRRFRLRYGRRTLKALHRRFGPLRRDEGESTQR